MRFAIKASAFAVFFAGTVVGTFFLTCYSAYQALLGDPKLAEGIAMKARHHAVMRAQKTAPPTSSADAVHKVYVDKQS